MTGDPVDQLKLVREWIGNLLAVIHRDGGHYYEKHGLEKACNDAQDIVCRLRFEIDALEHIHLVEKTILDGAIRVELQDGWLITDQWIESINTPWLREAMKKELAHITKANKELASEGK